MKIISEIEFMPPTWSSDALSTVLKQPLNNNNTLKIIILIDYRLKYLMHFNQNLVNKVVN